MAYMTDASGILGAMQTELATKNSTSTKAGKDLTTDDFLVLMCAMFQNQDIDNTASTADMMNQFVQISVIQAVTDISNLISDTSTLTYASSLVGKDVTIGIYNGNKLEEIEGKVTGTGTLNGEQVIFIGDDIYKLTDIMAIGKLPEVKDPENPDGTGKPGETEKPGGTTGGTDSTEKPGGTTGGTDSTEKPDGSTGGTDSTEKPGGTTGGTDSTEKPDGTTDNPDTTEKTDGTDAGKDDNSGLGNPNNTVEDDKVTKPLLA